MVVPAQQPLPSLEGAVTDGTAGDLPVKVTLGGSCGVGAVTRLGAVMSIERFWL